MNKKLTIASLQKKKMPSGLVYVYECGICGRRFTKSTMDGTLKSHKDKNGNACYGIGNFVESKVKIR
jgi:DNA-directed RNA polymerase subunit RPC12/RpoP